MPAGRSLDDYTIDQQLEQPSQRSSAGSDTNMMPRRLFAFRISASGHSIATIFIEIPTKELHGSNKEKNLMVVIVEKDCIRGMMSEEKEGHVDFASCRFISFALLPKSLA
jgi:hypothetical protein